jgi:hypothetical protein
LVGKVLISVVLKRRGTMMTSQLFLESHSLHDVRGQREHGVYFFQPRKVHQAQPRDSEKRVVHVRLVVRAVRDAPFFRVLAFQDERGERGAVDPCDG